MSDCNYCGNPITWTKDAEDRPTPLNSDGSPHRCRTFKKANDKKAEPVPAAATQAKPVLVEHKIGVLISHHATGCTVRMANGDKNYALASRLPEVELPQKMEFAVDKLGFVRGKPKFLGKVNPEGLTPAHEILKDNINKLEEEQKQKAATATATAAPARTDTPKSTSPSPGQPALPGGEKKNGAQVTPQSNGSSGKAPDPGTGDARRDPAWTNYSDKESWLRYISTLNTATAILENVWQPDPAKPMAEQIADKIEWVQGVAGGLRRRYEKDKGGSA